MRRARTRADGLVRGRTYVALQVPEVLRLCQAVARSALLLPERHAALLQARLRPVSRLSIDTFTHEITPRDLHQSNALRKVEERERERERERTRGVLLLFFHR